MNLTILNKAMIYEVGYPELWLCDSFLNAEYVSMNLFPMRQ